MAVEASHRMNLFPSEVISSRDFVRGLNSVLPNGIGFPCGNGLVLPNESASIPDVILPVFPVEYPGLVTNKVLINNRADSGLTCSVQPVAPSPSDMTMSRKRLRDECSQYDGGYTTSVSKCPKIGGGFSSLIDGDIVFQMNQQQSEIDRYIAEHTHRLRMELEDRRKKYSRVLAEAVQECIMRRLKEKDDELSRLGKLNWALQERVRSLYVENQVWRDLAQTNEATANSLRSNLEQILAHVGEDRVAAPCVAVPDDDAVSSCGSSQPCGGAGSVAPEESLKLNATQGFRSCKICSKFESSVLLLPCRHLCLCSTCGSSSLTTCPVCSTVLSATVHVNMS